MTDQQLIGLARQVLNIANTDRRNNGYGGIVLASYHEVNGEVYRLRKVEQLLPKLLGERWLDNGRAKELGFGTIRKATEQFPNPPDAIIIVTAANMFLPTEKFKALPFEEQEKLVKNTGHDTHHRMAAEGLFRIVDCFSAVAQTPERVCNVVQEVKHGELVDKPVVTNVFDQKDFSGNLKMFGEKEELDFTKKNPARVN